MTYSTSGFSVGDTLWTAKNNGSVTVNSDDLVDLGGSSIRFSDCITTTGGITGVITDYSTWTSTGTTWNGMIPPYPQGYSLPYPMARRLGLLLSCGLCCEPLVWCLNKIKIDGDRVLRFYVAEHLTSHGLVCSHREPEQERNLFDLATAQCESLLDL